MTRLSVFDCFSGLGGLSIGAHLAGNSVVGGVDYDPAAVSTFARTFPSALALEHNLLEEKPQTILKAANLAKGDIDVLVGGPPCQPYSFNNHQRGLSDARCGLVGSYLEFVSLLRPEWIVMENVPGFKSIENGLFLKTIVKSLRLRGYDCDFLLVNANRFGVPQQRKRLIVVGCRSKNRVAKVLAGLEGVKRKSVTVSDAIGDLPPSLAHVSGYVNSPSCSFQRKMRIKAGRKILNHSSSGLGAINLERIKHVPQGGNWRDIPRKLLPEGMKRAKLSDHTTRYGRLEPSKASHTILTKCDPHWGCFLHPTQDRVITVREAARIQSIPDRVEFPSSLTAAYRLVGNAVPPLLAESIFNLISKQN